MKSVITATAASIFALFATSCGPDPFVGTYSISITAGMDTTTSPFASVSTPTGTGVLAITAGTANPYDLTFSGASAGDCLLHGTAGGMGIALTAGQSCTFTNGSNAATATLSSGSMVVMSGSALTVTLVYVYSGTTVGVTFNGSGMRTIAGTRE